MARRKKTTPEQIDISAVLNAPVSVKMGGISTKMSPFESGMRSQFERASKGDLRALTGFIERCKKYGLVKPGQLADNVLFVPAEILLKADWSKVEQDAASPAERREGGSDDE